MDIAEMIVSLILLFFVWLILGGLYLWFLWLVADMTNPNGPPDF